MSDFLKVTPNENNFMAPEVGSMRHSIANNAARPSTIKKTIKGGGGRDGRMSSRGVSQSMYFAPGATFDAMERHTESPFATAEDENLTFDKMINDSEKM